MQYSALVLLPILVLSMFVFLPRIAMGENDWKIAKSSLNGHILKIPYKINGGDLKQIQINGGGFYGLIIRLENATHDGTIYITVPRDQLEFVGGQVTSIDGKATKNASVNSSLCSITYSIKFPSHSNEIEIQWSPSLGPPAVINPLYVSTDKNNYKLGEIITVSGCTVLSFYDDKEVILEVLNPEGRIYKTISVTPNTNGSFSSSFVLEGVLAINGSYTAKATYSGQSATSSFVVPEFPAFSLPILASALFVILATRLVRKRHQ